MTSGRGKPRERCGSASLVEKHIKLANSSARANMANTAENRWESWGLVGRPSRLAIHCAPRTTMLIHCTARVRGSHVRVFSSLRTITVNSSLRSCSGGPPTGSLGSGTTTQLRLCKAVCNAWKVEAVPPDVCKPPQRRPFRSQGACSSQQPAVSSSLACLQEE